MWESHSGPGEPVKEPPASLALGEHHLPKLAFEMKALAKLFISSKYESGKPDEPSRRRTTSRGWLQSAGDQGGQHGSTSGATAADAVLSGRQTPPITQHHKGEALSLRGGGRGPRTRGGAPECPTFRGTGKTLTPPQGSLHACR